jgi:hypothetical protein
MKRRNKQIEADQPGKEEVTVRPTSVASVEVLSNLVLPAGTKAYGVKLACGCSSIVLEPPDKPPSMGAAAVCYSVDGSHISIVPTR